MTNVYSFETEVDVNDTTKIVVQVKTLEPKYGGDTVLEIRTIKWYNERWNPQRQGINLSLTKDVIVNGPGGEEEVVLFEAVAEAVLNFYGAWLEHKEESPA